MLYPEIPGQNRIKSVLAGAVASGNIHHAWLLTGASGAQTVDLAEAFARTLLCEKPIHEQACGNCESCRLSFQGKHPDFFRLKPRGKIRQMKMEDVRDLLKFISLKSFFTGYKVMVIEEAERLPREHANSLLKSLEEPPPKTVFILTCSKVSGLLPTIISRCQTLELEPLPQEMVLEWVKKNLPSSMDSDMLVKLSQGHIGRLKGENLEKMLKAREIAFSILEEWVEKGKTAVLEATDRVMGYLEKERKILEKEMAADLKKMKQAEGVKTDKAEEEMAAQTEGFLKQILDDILDVFASILRDIRFIQESFSLETLLNPDKKTVLQKAAELLHNGDSSFVLLDKTRKSLQRTANQKLALESFFLQAFE